MPKKTVVNLSAAIVVRSWLFIWVEFSFSLALANYKRGLNKFEIPNK